MAQTVIIDIGSTSVGGAILEVPKKKQGTGELCNHLVASVRNETSFQEDIDLPRYLDGIVEVLKKTLADLAKTTKGKPGSVQCFLSAPFYASRTQEILKAEAKPFMVTPKIVTDLIAADIGRFKQAQPHLFKEGDDTNSHQVIENETLQLTLNGYQLAQPYRQSAEELAITSYLSIAASPIVTRFRQAVAAQWHGVTPEFHTFSYAFYKALMLVIADKKNFLILDIGGEITEISIVWRGLLWRSISFPLGHNWLICQLTKKFATTPAEIMSSLKLYLDSTQHNTVAAKMEKELVAAKDEWLTAFREALTKILDNCILPENVFVLAEPVMVNIFRSWLKEEQFEHLTISNKKFEVKVLKDDVFGSFCVHGDTAIHDFTLMVEAIFCDKITKA
jgi:cell division ATPase FtsA